MHASPFLSLLFFTLSSAFFAGANAHACGPPGQVQRQLERRVFATPTDEASAAQITDPADVAHVCQVGYVYQPMTALKDQFPATWDIAAIVPGDTVAEEIFNKINATVPNIPPKQGTPSGAWTPEQRQDYPHSDPDCWWSYSTCTTPKAPDLAPDIVSCAEPDTWGLSFDDGPNCSHNAFYDFLLANQQKATLYYIGSNVFNHPLEAQRGLQDGHEINVHTWSHHYMTALTNEQVFAELYYTAKIIHDVIGVTPRAWRPPYGDVDDRVRAIAQGLGMTTNMWRDDTFDWKLDSGAPTSSILNNYKQIIASASAGGYSEEGTVILEHELTNDTMQMVVDEYPKLKEVFKYVVPMGACVNRTHPYLEDITYPDFNDYIAGTTMPVNLPSPQLASSAPYTVPVGPATASITNLLGLPTTAPAINGAFQAAATGSGAAGAMGTSTKANSGGSLSAAGAMLGAAGIVAGALLI